MTLSDPSHLALIALAYLLGCANAGYYLVRWKTGRDVRDAGSGGTGATNVGRQLGTQGFLLTLLFDALKGALAVGIARQTGAEPHVSLLALAATLAGHVWPFQLRFKGGKGVAPFLGGLLVLNPSWLLWSGAIFGLLWLPWRKYSLAGLAAFNLLPLVVWWRGATPEVPGGLVLCGALILIAHRGNIRREIAQAVPGTSSAAGLDTGTLAAEPGHEHRETHRL